MSIDDVLDDLYWELSIDDVLDDLYWKSYYWDTLYDCHFFVEDAERVLYLYECCGYSYSQAILETLCEIEDELYDWWGY